MALLDAPRLSAQLVGLERRTARSGKDSIDHQPGGHDDIANAAAGVLVSTVEAGTGYTLDNVFDDDRSRTKQPRSDGRWTEGELLMRSILGLKQ